MGLTISYTIRLRKIADIPGFLAAARAQAKKLKWKTSRAARGSLSVELHPHPRCEPVRLDFSASLTCDEFVKTSSAPMKAHEEIVAFLRAMQPLARSLQVEDEAEFWETGDRKRLKANFDQFKRAFRTTRPRRGEEPITFSLGAMTLKPDRKGRLRAPKQKGTVVIVK